MGAVGCKTHDVSAGIIVCPHISRFIEHRTLEENKNEITNIQIESVTIKQPYRKKFAYCAVCKKKHLLPTIYFWVSHYSYYTLPPLFNIRQRAFHNCIECFYKELFDIELKRFYPEEGGIDFTPVFTGNDLKILLTEENEK